eukprot:CAMPEP_0197701370 /NCGR_PEP_ID=MMETSP1338-20131121/123115_1 /TAXON_ID=43686 ORGANISM="Pelagodinium beii, Strain RCC1491" /NCGR_SAMPLE_ID=MMETSP1338 /ASSEMBLY_ACC=CAM_ASM_000754 /LENGTH=46 /DNA_ID= /DNA_START= /DNA_END= /DNA_ORIENTATION=
MFCNVLHKLCSKDTASMLSKKHHEIVMGEHLHLTRIQGNLRFFKFL